MDAQDIAPAGDIVFWMGSYGWLYHYRDLGDGWCSLQPVQYWGREMMQEPVEASVYRRLHWTRFDHINAARRARAYQAELAAIRAEKEVAPARHDEPAWRSRLSPASS